jgi:hypothetical protein
LEKEATTMQVEREGQVIRRRNWPAADIVREVGVISEHFVRESAITPLN